MDSADEDLLTEERKHIICQDLLPQLYEKERMVIELKYGLNGKEEASGKEIMEKLGCSRVTYQNIVMKALDRLSKFDKGVAKDLYDATNEID